MNTYEVTRGPHYDADATVVVPEPYYSRNNFYIVFPAVGIVSYKQIISRHLFARCSLAGRALSNTGEQTK